MKIFWVVLLLVLTSRGAVATTLEGRVVGVADGDTVTVLDADRQQHKIRLGGIDAPEKAQPFGQKSKENLSRMVFGKDVRVEWKKRDKYKRIVGKVWVQPESCPTCPMTLDAGHAQITV
jgi:endonuclease YncB( thermonuclease family)